MLKNIFVNRLVYLFTFLFLFLSCKKQQGIITEVERSEISIKPKYATGFEYINDGKYNILKVTNPWPNAEQSFEYLLLKNDQKAPEKHTFDAIIEIPLKKIVVTSTTHIPALEALGVEHTLVGFPNTEYVSSEKTRKRIDENLVTELGKNESINTEVLLNLQPDAVVGFSIDSNNKTFANLQKAGIPVLYNGDWVEEHPLGKAEWITFFGYLFGKEKEAKTIFKTIEENYNNAKELAQQVKYQPTVLSGALYKDQWHLPYGNSWAAQFIKDANGDYLWSDTEGSGSITLNFESVLDKSKTADFWISPSYFTSRQQMLDNNDFYKQFDAFTNNQVYGFAAKKGATGGLLFYELAPNRPDLILKDLIKIMHPEVLPEYELYFYKKLD